MRTKQNLIMKKIRVYCQKYLPVTVYKLYLHAKSRNAFVIAIPPLLNLLNG